MELIFIPKDTGEDLINFPIDEIVSKELEEIKLELKKIDQTYILKEINVGEGADWIFILAVLNGITTVFLLGDKIEKGLEGWIKIGGRIKKLFSKTDRIYLDKIAATVVALNYISENYKLDSVKLVMESELSIKDLSGMLTDRKTSDFIAKPYAVYYMTFEINELLLITLSIRSDGKVDEINRFDKNDFIPF